MTLEHRTNNPIQRRKDAVRKHSRNAVVCVAGGLGAGLVLSIIVSSWFFLTLGLVVAVAGGGYNALQVKKLVNGRD